MWRTSRQDECRLTPPLSSLRREVEVGQPWQGLVRHDVAGRVLDSAGEHDELAQGRVPLAAISSGQWDAAQLYCHLTTSRT